MSGTMMNLSECPTAVTQKGIHIRQQLQEQPGQYISDTFTYIQTVKDFCDRETEWTSQRESEIKEMTECCRNKEPKNSQGDILSNTLKGLEELHIFLDAVEKLAVTSLFVFMVESFPLEGVNTEAVQSVISAVRSVSPLLIPFKREDRAFFSPEPDNVDLLVHQLHKYICITKQLCKKIRSSKILEVTGIHHHTTLLSLNTSHDDLNQLSRIRMDESFRLTYLFDAEEFVNEYEIYKAEMSKSLSGLEKNAVCLNRMKDAYSICTIIDSLAGIIGASLSIAGLVGTSLTLAWWGGVLGLVSTIISLLTGFADFTVNRYCVNEAKSTIDSFMRNMQKVVDCLEQAASSQRRAPHLDEAGAELGAMKAMKYFKRLSKGFDAIMDGTAVLEPVDFSRLSAPMTLAVNGAALFADLLFFFVELWSIYRRKKSNVSQLICSRTALWRSEMETWKRMNERLCTDKVVFQRNKDKLEAEIRK